MLSLRSCIAQFHPKHNAFKRVSNSFAFISSTEACFWLKRVSDRPFFAFEKRVSNPIIKTALRLSSAKITLKVVWKPNSTPEKVEINAVSLKGVSNPMHNQNSFAFIISQITLKVVSKVVSSQKSDDKRTLCLSL